MLFAINGDIYQSAGYDRLSMNMFNDIAEDGKYTPKIWIVEASTCSGWVVSLMEFMWTAHDGTPHSPTSPIRAPKRP